MSQQPPRTFAKETKVLLLESIHATAHELFATEGFSVESVPGAISEDELCARIGKFDLVGIRSKTRLTARVLEAGKNLLGVGAFCIGTNQIDLETANRLGIPVFNSPFSNTRSVAELVISEIVALSRHIGDRSREIHEGKWRKTAAGSFEVRGKTVGIIGYGHIGSQVGVLAENMGMRVVSYDIRTTLPMGNNRAVASLDELFDEADFVTLHVPETPETRMMIGKAELAAMKKGACLLNLSRGSVVDIAALADALKAKHIGGAAIDVYPEEPEGNTDDFKTPLQGLPNVILTPHIGGSTLEAQANIGREVGTSLIRLTNAGATTGAVNFPQIELPPKRETHRVLNVHKNVPGVLSDINKIVSEKSANIMGQVLSTDPNIGYLIMDLDKEVAGDVNTAIAALPASIKTRILY
jgi:D-3-phosphoglycerate dehydrogenase / 2-oxoglutarate reductase